MKAIFWAAAVVVLAAGIPAFPQEDGRSNYEPLILAAAEKFDLDADLIHSIIEAESAYNPQAVSSKGAMGLMQLIPETATRYGVTDPFDPQQNIEGGANYLKDLLRLHQQDLRRALAASNAGPEAVKKHNGVPPFAETEHYVRKVLRIYNRRGGTPPGRLYAYRDGQGKVLLTTDRFYLALKGDAAGGR